MSHTRESRHHQQDRTGQDRTVCGRLIVNLCWCLATFLFLVSFVQVTVLGTVLMGTVPTDTGTVSTAANTAVSVFN